MPDDPASTWNHTKYQPDVIVVNVGTDLDSGPLDDATLIDAYAAFVGTVRAAHPRAFLLLSESNFQTDGSDGRPAREREALLRVITAVVARHQQAGDVRVRVVRTGFQPGTPTDTHPVAFQHEPIALNFLGPIREVTGWWRLMNRVPAAPMKVKPCAAGTMQTLPFLLAHERPMTSFHASPRI